MRNARRPDRLRRGLLAPALAACVGAIALALPPSRPATADAATPTGPTGDTGSSTCPASNPPNTVVLVAGTPQTAPLGSQFQTNLQAELANTNGCPVTTPVVGTPITFTAPASGPSGTFSMSGSDSATVGADGSGMTAAGIFTANDTAGSYAVTASSPYGSVSFALTNTAAGLPASITPLAPTSQSATAGTRYGQPLEVRVLDANGTPVVGATVTFNLGSTAVNGSGSGNAAAAGFPDGAAQATEQANSAGIATSPSFTANSTAGRFTATAAVAHIIEPASFALDNLAAKALTIKPASSTHETATVDTRYRRPLKVRVLDSVAHPVAGTTVTFTLGSGAAGAASSPAATFVGGQSQATATTNANGSATSPQFTANSMAGTMAATATVTAAAGAAQFRLRNRAASPAKIAAGVAASESTTIATGFPVALAVTVTDAHGNAVSGARVTFTAPASGPSGTFPGHHARRVIVRTDGSGIAVAPRFTASDIVGGYVVTATTGRARVAAFALVNLPPGPSA